jgi:hypothetical protein
MPWAGYTEAAHLHTTEMHPCREEAHVNCGSGRPTIHLLGLLQNTSTDGPSTRAVHETSVALIPAHHCYPPPCHFPAPFLQERVSELVGESLAPDYWFAASKDGCREAHYRGEEGMACGRVEGRGDAAGALLWSGHRVCHS